jgi:hypothetical protein
MDQDKQHSELVFTSDGLKNLCYEEGTNRCAADGGREQKSWQCKGMEDPQGSIL